MKNIIFASIVSIMLSGCIFHRFTSDFYSVSELEEKCKQKAYSCGMLATRYYNKKKYEQAFKYDNIACQAGNFISCYNVAFYYESGLGTSVDYEKSTRFYTKIYENGYPIGLSRIGDFYKDGLGVKKDFEKALEHYKKACELGSKEACNRLEYIYEKGENVRQNSKIANEYARRARNAKSY